MLLLLMYVLILGVIAYAISYFPIPQPFRVAAWCIILIILIILVFRTIGVGVDLPVR